MYTYIYIFIYKCIYIYKRTLPASWRAAGGWSCTAACRAACVISSPNTTPAA